MEQANLLALFRECFEPPQYVQLNARTLRIRLQPKVDRVPVCLGCVRAVSQVHDLHWRQVRERGLFSHRVWQEIPVRRLRCPSWGPSREQIPAVGR